MSISCIDADEISPPDSALSSDMAIGKVIEAVEHSLKTSDSAILAWVFAKSRLYQPFLDHFSNLDIRQLYILCSTQELQRRLNVRGDNYLVPYALQKLDLINALPFEKIDTSEMDTTDVAYSIRKTLQYDAKLRHL